MDTRIVAEHARKWQRLFLLTHKAGRAQHKELPAAISAKVDGQSQNEVHTVKEELREKEEIKGF